MTGPFSLPAWARCGFREAFHGAQRGRITPSFETEAEGDGHIKRREARLRMRRLPKQLGYLVDVASQNASMVEQMLQLP